MPEAANSGNDGTSPPAPASTPPAGGGGGSPPAPDSGNAGGSQTTSLDGPAWDAIRLQLAGGNVDRTEFLKKFDNADALVSRLMHEPDWRKQMAGDDTEAMSFLERYTDPQAAFKAWKAATVKLSEGGKVKIPGENATPEEIAEYTKAIGVPEKPDGYKITVAPPDGLEIDETNKAMLGTITEKVHEALSKGAKPNDLVNLAHEIYYNTMAEQIVQGEQRAADLALEGEAELRKLWGDNGYRQNVALAIEAAKKFFPESASKEQTTKDFDKFMGLKLETGHSLFDHPIMQRMFAQIARDSGVVEDPFFRAAMEKGGGSFDPEKRIAEIHAMRSGTGAQRAEYAKLSQPGGELEKLTEAVNRKKGIAA